MKKHNQFTVLGKPFFSIGGQVHNSSGYSMGLELHGECQKDTEKAFASVTAISANTIAVPVCWNALEPEEGQFNTSYVCNIIDQVRNHDLHAILLWFGTWKNGQMEYTPNWIKTDRKRFPRVCCKDGLETTVLSPHCRTNLEQDKKAFCYLMRLLLDYDRDTGTVIAVQVENEAGIYAPTRRDFGSWGEEAFQKEVPGALIMTAKMRINTLMHKAWIASDRQEKGNWHQIFGGLGAELCTAWAIAGYIDEIGEAGKKIYDLFMYTNVWTDRNGDHGWNLGGLEYPCGGAVSKVLPAWYCACSHLDAISPDIYETEPGAILKTQMNYAHQEEGWPLYIPESGFTSVNATFMFHAVGALNAIGCHIFGVESCLAQDGRLSEAAKPIRQSFVMLQKASELILKYSNTGKMHAICQYIGQDSLYLELEGWKCRVSFTGMSMDYAGWVPMDYHHDTELDGQNKIPMSLSEETGRGLLFQVNDREFYLIGHKVRLFFARPEPEDGSIPYHWLNNQHQAHTTEFLLLEEGYFENGRFFSSRIRSGDESRHGVWAQYDCGVVHFILGGSTRFGNPDKYLFSFKMKNTDIR